jgi:Tfp pilus assembly protein PilF
LRSAYELLAFDYYQKSDERRAEGFLKSAQRVVAKGEKRELEHNLAVVDLVAGRVQQAEKVFDALGGRPAESLVNLGIVRDKQGDAKKALELYKRALDHGAKAPKLREWIDVKERLFGEVKS